ncbi:MAG: hypothetical protein HFI90_02440 [Clostridia bacterium]|nr:hypothetical protein [Clostridia bacterium]
MNKPRRALCGRELYAVQPGCRAFLETDRGQLMTSKVVRILYRSTKQVVIEIENSIYDITLTGESEPERAAV